MSCATPAVDACIPAARVADFLFTRKESTVKTSFRIIPLALAIVGASFSWAAHAQEVTEGGTQEVHDEKAFDQRVEQHDEQQKAMAEQLEQLQKQLDAVNAQKEAMTGSSGQGAISTEDYADSVPRDWRETLDALNNGGKVSELAKAMRDKAEKDIESTGDIKADAKKNLDNGFDNAINGQALNAAAYEASTKRIENLTKLQEQIDKTKSVKEAADLQARIQVESSLINNELVRTQSMNAMLQQTEYARAYQSMRRDADDDSVESVSDKP
jgi:type IV secretion system protein VirB5